MRGADIQYETLFSTVNPEKREPSDHPLRPTREIVPDLAKNKNANLIPLRVLGELLIIT